MTTNRKAVQRCDYPVLDERVHRRAPTDAYWCLGASKHYYRTRTRIGIEILSLGEESRAGAPASLVKEKRDEAVDDSSSECCFTVNVDSIGTFICIEQ